MKKFSIALLTIVFALGMAFTAQAQNLVEVKTTTDPIQLFPCEKSGAISFAFDPGSVLSHGDWWIVRLPYGVTLCRDIDVEISNGEGNAILSPVNASYTAGPVEYDQGGGDAILGNGGVYFRVSGQSGSQQVRIDVLSPVGVGGYVQLDDNSSSPPGAITIKLWDSVPQVGFIWIDSDDDGTYGDDHTGTNPDQGTKADNTMCIDARNISGNCVEVSYDSRDDYLTFTGDNVVACRVSGEDIQCVSCKGEMCDISLTTEQTTVCDYDYETPTGTRACCTVGNRIVFQNNTTFFGDQPSDEFQVIVTITNPTSGVAFAGTGLAVQVSDMSSTDLTDCVGATAGAIVTPANVYAYLSNGTTEVTSFNPGDCALSASETATILVTDPAAGFSGLDDDNQIWVNLPGIVFDPTLVSASTTLTVQVELVKLPCTTLATCTVDIGHFVDNCDTPATDYSWTIPYSTAMNDSVWWSGAALSNCSSADADCTLTFNEEDGDAGTYDVSIAGGGMWISLFSSIQGDITQTLGTGSIGDSAMFICATCTGGSVRVFFLLGDGTQAQGSAIGPGNP
jgi:hypothetical protein